MNCSKCGALNAPEAKFCRNCGSALISAQASAMAGNRDIMLLVGYIGWHFFVYIIYGVLSYIVIPVSGSDLGASIGSIYQFIEWIQSIIDIGFLLVLIFLLRHPKAKMFTGLFLAIKIMLLLMRMLQGTIY